jgi:cobalt-zinc-cadmium efflux system membrane fusion protein
LLDATDKDVAVLQIGKIVTIRSPIYPEADFPAKIVSVSDFLDPVTRTLKARATVDNSHRRLKAEMFVTGELDTGKGPRMQVPAKAVFFQGGHHYVFTEEGPGRFMRREVRVGEEHGGSVTILSGLQDGQRVIADDVLMLQQMLQPRRVQK